MQQAPDLSDVRLDLVTPDPVVVPAELGQREPHLPASALRERYSCASRVVAIALSPNVHVSGVTATLESMACGRALVVTRNPGMEEYVDHGRTGLLVPPGDPEAMAGAIAELLRDPDRRREMGEAGRRWVLERFTTADMAESVADVDPGGRRLTKSGGFLTKGLHTTKSSPQSLDSVTTSPTSR